MTTKELNARNGLWIGTKQYQRFVPAPSRGADATSVGYSETATGKNGGGYVAQSFGRHKTFQYDWPRSTDRQYATFLQGLRDGTYGRGVVHFTDPTCYLTNVMAPHWANPGLTIGYDSPPLVFRQQPEEFEFGRSDRANTPLIGATYRNLPSSFNTADSFYVAIPPGKMFVFGTRYSAAGGGAVFLQPVRGVDGINEADRIQMPAGLDPENPYGDLVNRQVPGSTFSGVYVWVGRTEGSSALASSVSILDMIGKLVPEEPNILGPVETRATNLFTDPRFATTDGTVEVYRNQVNNPRFLAQDGVVEVRRNFMLRPSLRGSTSGWTKSSVTVLETAQGLELTSTGAGPSFSLLNRDNTEQAASPGQSWAGSIRVENIGAIPVSLRARQYWNQALSFADGANVTIPPGEFRVLTVVGTAPAATTHVRFTLATATSATPFPSGGKIRVTEAINELSTINLPWFDGSGQSVSDPDLTEAWTGPVNASPSILTGRKVAGLTTGFAASVAAIMSSRGGRPCLRVIRLNNDFPDPWIATNGGSGAPTWTGILSVWRDTNAIARTASVAALERATGAYVGTTIIQNSTLPAPGEWKEFRHTRDLASNDARLLMNAPVGVGDSFFYSHPSLVAGVYNGPYFDGSESPDPDMTARWIGATDASASVLEGKRIAGLITNNCIVIQSTRFADPGEFSARQIPHTASTNSYFEPTPTALPATGTATIMGTRHLDNPLTGPRAEDRAGRLVRAVPVVVSSPQSPNVAGTHPMRHVFTTDGPRALFGHGGAWGSGDVYWTKPGLFAGEYDGPAFSGSDPAEGNVYYEWAGAVDNSVSRKMYQRNRNWMRQFDDQPWYGGEGHSGVKFDGQPTIQYDGLNNTAISATFTEVGSWELASRL